MMNAKTYKIITFGCQMNEHDSEIISGMLSQRGYIEFTESIGKTGLEDTCRAGDAETSYRNGNGAAGDPDIIIINTCSIRENADQRFFGTLGQLKKIKLRNPEFTVCVCGCMMQQEHVTAKLRQSYPWVDVIFGTHNVHEFPDLLEEMYRRREACKGYIAGGAAHDEAPVSFSTSVKGTSNCRNEQKPPLRYGSSSVYKQFSGFADKLPLSSSGFSNYAGGENGQKPQQIRSAKDYRVERVYEDREEIPEGLPARRLFGHKSFVNIMYGCNNFCTYCIVPYTRGREKSRTPENIIREVKGLVADGVKEVTLLGQNVNSYRGVSDETDREWDFTDLIWELAEIDGLERIRFMTSHPKDLSDKLIDAFARCDKLCNYIHLPVQSGSSTVLKRMNRKYDRDRYLELVRKLREAVPGIAISTDIIVGFPGETEEEFEETLTLAKAVQYDSAFTFLYSPRKGTPAAEYEGQIPEKIKHERFNRLVEVMNEGSKKKNAAYVGRTCRVLVDGSARKQPAAHRPESGVENEESCQNSKKIILLNGRTEEFKLVDFPGTKEMIGRIIDVKITDSNTFSLRGEVIND